MKRKNYKVKVKLIFETTMDHSQTSMKKAQEDVNRVLTDYLKDKKLKLTWNRQKRPHGGMCVIGFLPKWHLLKRETRHCKKRFYHI